MENGPVERHAFFLVRRKVHAGFFKVPVVEHFVFAGRRGGVRSGLRVRAAEHFGEFFF